MESLRPQKIARSVLALLLGLVAATHAATAQRSEAPPAPPLELTLGPGAQWVEPDLLLVPFELRNAGAEPVVVAQRPGVFLGMSCLTEDGARGMIPGGVACSLGGSFLELGPGEALMGEKAVRIPDDCVNGITVDGFFQALYAGDWDLPAHEARIRSKPFEISRR
ncbi:MAG TPA: hypothetical protein VOA87_20915 [Thermoanaerobaculia bacterium]|nr:hypothetical protein [Thermoanaerobaculia bacterium]